MFLKGYDWDQEFDAECKITQTGRRPWRTTLGDNTAPPCSVCLLFQGLAEWGLKPVEPLCDGNANSPTKTLPFILSFKMFRYSESTFFFIVSKSAQYIGTQCTLPFFPLKHVQLGCELFTIRYSFTQLCGSTMACIPLRCEETFGDGGWGVGVVVTQSHWL